LALCTRYPLQVALIASLAANVWLWRGWDREQDARAADKAAYEKAQDEARAKQAAQDVANVLAQTERNELLEQAHVQTEIATRGAIADYIASHRVRPQAVSCPASGAGQAGLSADTAAPVEAGPVAELVAVTTEDFKRASTASMQGAECHSFLNGLVDEGLAKAAD
jgi:hypothetical protein